MKVKPVTLEGTRVRVEPVSLKHAEDLFKASRDENLWRYLPSRANSLEEMAGLIEGAVRLAEAGQGFGFAIIDRKIDVAVGFSGYWNLAPEHARLEIGMTWLRPESQRTGINTEMKYLMIRHPFEDLDCERVELKTDARNIQSQNAMERIGAVREGTLRNHMQYPNGERRDTVYFSFIRSEWPEKKIHLEHLLSKYS